MDDFKVEIIQYKAINKGGLIGAFNVALYPLGIVIRDCKLCSKDGKNFISFPSREYEKDGEKKYSNYIAFTTQDADFKVKNAILKEINNVKLKDSTNASTTSSNRAGNVQGNSSEVWF